MNALTIDRNLLDPDLIPAEQGPPHVLFDLWREHDPLHWNPANPDYSTQIPGNRMTEGFWVVTRYDDVLEVSRDQDRFSSHDGGFVIWDLDGEELARQQSNFMGMRPADHLAVKRVIVPPFSPKAVKAFLPKLERLAGEIIDDVAARGSCEFVSEVASRLPVYAFCELMGIPEHYRQKVADFGNAMADVEERSSLSLDPLIALNAIAMELTEEKRRNPDDGLMSAMVNDRTLNLSDVEICQFFMVFAVAGHETTRSSIAHFIHLMNRHPDQYRLLLSDFEAHIDNAIEEVLRYTAITTNFRRTATCGTEIGGRPVRKGDKIYMSYAAVNRDPAVFADPHRFDITRENARRHVTFGNGPHLCVGAHLARQELRLMIREIVTRIPDIRLDGEPEWLRSIWFNAIVKMPVTFTPERR